MHILLESKVYLFSTQTLKISNECLAIQAKMMVYGKAIFLIGIEGLSPFGPKLQLTAY